MAVVSREGRAAELPGESRFDLFFEEVRIPWLPKFGVHGNMNALLITSVTTMIVALWSDSRWNDQIYTLTHLIPCFFIGILCGVGSIVTGLLACQLADGRGFLVARYPLLASLHETGKVWISASISLMLLSNLIFFASAGWGLYVMARAAAIISTRRRNRGHGRRLHGAAPRAPGALLRSFGAPQRATASTYRLVAARSNILGQPGRMHAQPKRSSIDVK